jgi:tetratricopeptide (TPR) repeat protein
VDSNFQVAAESAPTDANEWALPVPLGRGRNYYWQVTATLAGGEEVISPRTPAPRAKFRVLDAEAADELRRLEEAAPESHLARGVLYARAGLIEEAEAEFRKLVALNPRSPVARRLLRSVGRR